MKRSILALLALMLAVAAVPGMAQPVTNSKSGLVQYIEGEVFLDDKPIAEPIVAQFSYMKDGGILRTTEGRAEVMMNPGISMRLGENSALKMVSERFIDTRVELTRGSGVVSFTEYQKYNSFTVICKDAIVTIEKAGHYHFDVEPARLKVFAGLATVKVGADTFEVTAGKTLNFGGALASLEKFNKDDTDALDRWSARRGELMAAANASSAREVYDQYGMKDPCYTPNYVSSTTANPCVGTWKYNRWFGLWTYIPINARLCDPYWGYCYYNPMSVYSTYYRPQPTYTYNPTGGFNQPSYSTYSPASGGYSGGSAAASSVMSAPSGGSGSTASSSAAASSSGRGSASGGGTGGK